MVSKEFDVCDDVLVVSGNVGGVFAIDRTLGLVSVTSSELDQPVYWLTVEAADGGTPSLSSTAVLTVTVATSSTTPPVFDRDQYSVEVRENEPGGTVVVVVHAYCQSSVVYSLSNVTDNLFSVDPSSGVVFTTIPLDFERSTTHSLTVHATNIAGGVSVSSLVIHVVDMNDNRPVFTASSYVGNVSEASPAGSYIVGAGSDRHSPLVVRATDADSGQNALLTYSITDAVADDVFEIDAATGAVRTRVVLDRELRSVYRFTVTVRDSGIPPLTAQSDVSVTVYVDDTNDSPPVFTQQVCQRSCHGRLVSVRIQLNQLLK